MDAFSRTALATFSPQWKKQLDLHPEYCVAEGPYRGVFKLILDWIKLCIEEGNDVKFPDVSPSNQNTSPLQLSERTQIAGVARKTLKADRK